MKTADSEMYWSLIQRHNNNLSVEIYVPFDNIYANDTAPCRLVMQLAETPCE
jgi:hypothetical protein